MKDTLRKAVEKLQLFFQQLPPEWTKFYFWNQICSVGEQIFISCSSSNLALEDRFVFEYFLPRAGYLTNVNGLVVTGNTSPVPGGCTMQCQQLPRWSTLPHMVTLAAWSLVTLCNKRIQCSLTCGVNVN